MVPFSTRTRLLTALLLLVSFSSRAQLQLTSATPVTQTFDGLGTSATASVPAGFQLSGGISPAYGASDNTTVTTQAGGTSGTGALNGTSTGGAYNFAAGSTATSSDRALGYLSSSGYSSPRNLLLAVRNATGQPLTQLLLEYDIEKYRTGTRAFNWQLRLSRTGEANSWSGFVMEGSQTYPADASTGVLATPTSTRKSVTLGQLEAGATIYLWWQYTGSGGSTNAQALGLDNLTLTPTLGSTPVAPTITTGSVTGSPFCVGASGGAVSVPFTTTGALTGSFVAQLSDAAGAFSLDLTQNQIGSGTSSPLAATLPAGTPTGTGYRVRVVHVLSGTIGQPSPDDLTVTTPPASNSVSLNSSAPQSITTTGTGTTIAATAAAPSTFTWAYASSSTGPFTTVISGATAASYTPKGADFGGAGTYYLVTQATSTCGSVTGTSGPVQITVTAPQPTITVTPTPVPDFGSVTLGSASASQSVSLTGSNLSGSVTLTPPAGFQLRTGATAFSCAPLVLPVTGTSLSATVDVRFVPELAQSYSGTIQVAAPGTSALASITVTGTGQAPAYPATVRTTVVSAVTSTTAATGGTVVEDGGSPVTARGVVYATTEAPTLQDELTEDGTGAGTYTSALVDLLPNTTYFVRAYATNARGTSYGEQVRLTTAPAALAAEPTLGSTLTATTVAPTTITLAINGGNGQKRLLLVTQGPALTFEPQDGTTFAANATFGQGDQPTPGTYVVLAAPATAVTVTGLQANTEYTFAIFDYNDNATSGTENYLLTPHGELTLSTLAPIAGLLLTEDFDYPAGDLLNQHGWAAHSGNGTNEIALTEQSLRAPSYAPASGNAAALVASGEDVNRQFPSQPAGTAVYAALLVNVSRATTDYFFHLGPDPISTTFRARLFTRAAAGGGVQFGVSGSGTTTVYDPTVYSLNTTYLLVVRYVFGPSGTETRLYVNPGQQEPATANAVSVEAASSAPANIGSVALRQGGSTPQLTVDGLRIATGYEQARPFSAPLPVTLVSFTGKATGSDAQLMWRTAQELNNRGFVVERSRDGRTFSAVHSITGQGTTSQAHAYTYTDLNALTTSQPVYYRLQQVDTDGTAHYSAVVAVADANQSSTALTLYPNPAHRQVQVVGAAAATLQIVDLTGRVLRTQASTQTLHLEGLAPGMYLVRCGSQSARLQVE